ncbi:restriction endonuclease [Desulforamulus aeronauticus]|uniref:Restriction endonuclease n=1 Tax=Desulforamulus aeronauticus DSM 10349 TaxID=1121421 RepID=A0A1M6WED9_9FIRM|nr:restriction endonuclease [Desulforamulus aeronauticus]SHK91946.1 Restriction endonuclease [Desulforamulus aeronauticus DSM 10349]
MLDLGFTVFDLIYPLSVIFGICLVAILARKLLLSVTEFIALSIKRLIFNPISNHFEEKKELKLENEINFKPSDDIEEKLREVDQLKGDKFEIFLKRMFKDLGYYVEMTARVGDYGADLILLKDGYKISVQAKRYSKNVGLRAVQEVYASLERYVCDKGIVVTNSYFTQSAKNLANDTKVELWDREKLKEVLLSIKKAG